MSINKSINRQLIIKDGCELLRYSQPVTDRNHFTGYIVRYSPTAYLSREKIEANGNQSQNLETETNDSETESEA